jgi:hypothetical protein
MKENDCRSAAESGAVWDKLQPFHVEENLGIANSDSHVCLASRRPTDRRSAALNSAAEVAEPEKVVARQYSGKWNRAIQRPTSSPCYAARPFVLEEILEAGSP